MVGLVAIRAWEAGVVGPEDLLSVGVGVALGLAVVLLERAELAALLAIGGRLRGSVLLQLAAVFAVLATVTVVTGGLGEVYDLVAFVGLATVTLGELALLARET